MKRFPEVFYYMSVANLCFFLGNSFFILLPVYFKNLGASESYIGVMNNIDKILVILTSVTIGSIMHLWDRLKLLRLGYAVLLGAYLAYYGMVSLNWLVPFIRILHGVGFSLAMILGTTVIFDVVPKERAAESIGIYGVTGALSNAVSPAIGELLLRGGVQHRTLFLVSASLVLVSLVIAFVMPRPAVQDNNGDQAPTAVSGLYGNREYLLFSIITLIFGGGFGVIITYLPNFVRTTTSLSYSYFFVVYIAVLIVIRFTFIRLVGKISQTPLLACVLLLAAGMNALFNWNISMITLTLSGLVYGVAHGVLYPVLNAHLVGIVAQEDRGRSNALFTATFNGGMLVFAFGLGFLIDLWASYRVAFNVCAAAFVIAAALVVATRGEWNSGRGGLSNEG